MKKEYRKPQTELTAMVVSSIISASLPYGGEENGVTECRRFKRPIEEEEEEWETMDDQSYEW